MKEVSKSNAWTHGWYALDNIYHHYHHLLFHCYTKCLEIIENCRCEGLWSVDHQMQQDALLHCRIRMK